MEPPTAHSRAGVPERRDYSPPGRLRRILHSHRGQALSLLALLLLAAGGFVAATLWALDRRFERDAARIAYTKGIGALQFLAEREGARLGRLADSLATAENRLQGLAPNRPYLVVSLAERRVYYLRGSDTLWSAPVAVGSGKTLVVGGRTLRFQTPRGRMAITAKELNPMWVPPNWHYHEVAQARGLRVVDFSHADPDALTRMGFPPGQEPIRDGVIYILPWGSPQRRHPGVLGAAKLEIQDGYYFHGTKDEGSIGEAASHGCIRLRREDILWMYANVPVGTPVFIY